MKKRLILLPILTLSLTIVFSGCDSQSSSTQDTNYSSDYSTTSAPSGSENISTPTTATPSNTEDNSAMTTADYITISNENISLSNSNNEYNYYEYTAQIKNKTSDDLQVHYHVYALDSSGVQLHDNAYVTTTTLANSTANVSDIFMLYKDEIPASYKAEEPKISINYVPVN